MSLEAGSVEARMRLFEIQDEMRQLLDDAERELEAIKQAMAGGQELTAREANPHPAPVPATLAEPAPKEPTLQERLKQLASS